MASINPLRYRGYYCDGETGFYYLQSRYYDPVTHRFINADSLASTGQGIIGTNMFAYCNNCPILFSDPGGHRIVLSLEGSEDEIRSMIACLLLLSDDIIQIVGNELRIIAYRNGNRPTGTKLLRELIHSQQTITIKNTGSNKSKYLPDYEYTDDGKKPRYLPPTEPVGGVAYSIQGYNQIKGIPGVIAMGHELIHAWRVSNKHSLLPNPEAVVASFGCGIEEVYTVGLDPVNYYSPYTENLIRAEHGFAPRTAY